jgi:hypothetical protein
MTKPKSPRGWRTGAEHDAWLKETGQYDAMIERQRIRNEEIEKRVAENRRAEAPLVAELQAAGVQVQTGVLVQTVWDLVNTASPYPEALPILLAHLPRPYPAAVREGIARALAVPATRALGWEVLTRLYREEPVALVKAGLAAAIAAASANEVLEDVLALVRDRRHGESRVLLLSALRRSRDPRAAAALVELADDPDLTKEIQFILRRRNRARS